MNINIGISNEVVTMMNLPQWYTDTKCTQNCMKLVVDGVHY
jgi:hypothetical protein